MPMWMRWVGLVAGCLLCVGAISLVIWLLLGGA
jgi:hypothetical protein